MSDNSPNWPASVLEEKGLDEQTTGSEGPEV
jgi:hypothetical protein